jgi:16S rRNA (uracil1498-N3)-methyltransferase
MRCFVPSESWSEKSVVLSPDESHYVLNVLRAKAGQCVTLFDGAGRIGDGEIEDTTRHKVRVRVLSVKYESMSRPFLWLGQALAKGQKMDLVIQKATELGVARIVPMTTERAVVQVEGMRAESKVNHWRAVALNAVRQCEAAWQPEVADVHSLDGFLDASRRSAFLIYGDFGADSKPLPELFRQCRDSVAETVAVLIGPEGGFTDGEAESLLHAGAHPADFGETVLRAETAALYAASSFRYAFHNRK